MARSGTETRERILAEAQRLVIEQGLAATSVDDMLAAAGTSKGAFFHHFPTKNALARALVQRYADADVRHLEQFMAAAEAETDDPARQLVAFVRLFEEVADEIVAEQPGCLYVSYVAEKQLTDDGTNDVIVAAVEAWRERIGGKLRAAASVRAPRMALDVEALADHVFVTFEGAFILTRTLRDPGVMRAQLRQLRHYLELVFALEGNPPRAASHDVSTGRATTIR